MKVFVISEVLAFQLRADCVDMLTGLFNSLVLSMFPRPTQVFVISEALPLRLRADRIEMLIGLFKSLVLSTLAKLTMAFVIPATVPVNVGLARGALAAKAFVIVDA